MDALYCSEEQKILVSKFKLDEKHPLIHHSPNETPVGAPFRFSSVSVLAMYFSLNLFALFIWSLASGGFSATPPPLQCTQPTIRKEWRALSKAEQANWIAAVKVCRLSPHCMLMKPEQCLANIPALPLTGREFNGGGANGAPAYNSSGSAYDGCIWCRSVCIY
jgi:hypothetical protein